MRVVARLLPVIAVGWLLAIASVSMSNSAPASVSSYIGNTRSYVFHRQTCRYLPNARNRSYFESRKEAVDAGYRPCRKCRP